MGGSVGAGRRFPAVKFSSRFSCGKSESMVCTFLLGGWNPRLALVPRLDRKREGLRFVIFVPRCDTGKDFLFGFAVTH